MRRLIALFALVALLPALVSGPALAGGYSFLSGPLWSADGTAAAPQYSFAADDNTGIYRIGSDSFGLSAGGVLRAQVDTTGLVVPSGQTLGLAGATVGGQPTFTLSQTFPGITSSNGLTVNGALGTFNAGLTVPSGQTLTSAGTTTLNGILNGNATATWSGAHTFNGRNIHDEGADTRILFKNSGTSIGQIQATATDFRWTALTGSKASIWAAGQSVIEVAADASLVTLSKPVTFSALSGHNLARIIIGRGTSGYPSIGYNADQYDNNLYKYVVSDVASWMLFASGQGIFYTAASGTAGNAITPIEVGRYSGAGAWALGPAGASGVDHAINLKSSHRIQTNSAANYLGWQFEPGSSTATYRGFVGMSNATNGFVNGSVAGDLLFVTKAHNMLFSVNDGGAAQLKINQAGNVESRNYTALGDNPGSSSGNHWYVKDKMYTCTLDSSSPYTCDISTDITGTKIISVSGKCEAGAAFADFAGYGGTVIWSTSANTTLAASASNILFNGSDCVFTVKYVP